MQEQINDLAKSKLDRVETEGNEELSKEILNDDVVSMGSEAQFMSDLGDLNARHKKELT